MEPPPGPEHAWQERANHSVHRAHVHFRIHYSYALSSQLRIVPGVDEPRAVEQHVDRAMHVRGFGNRHRGRDVENSRP